MTPSDAKKPATKSSSRPGVRIRTAKAFPCTLTSRGSSMATESGRVSPARGPICSLRISRQAGAGLAEEGGVVGFVETEDGLFATSQKGAANHVRVGPE